MFTNDEYVGILQVAILAFVKYHQTISTARNAKNHKTFGKSITGPKFEKDFSLLNVQAVTVISQYSAMVTLLRSTSHTAIS
jgi:hypothetical protein